VSWRPVPSVLLNGQEVSSSAVGQVTVKRGRDSVYVEPSASYASVNFRSESGVPVTIGDRLTLRLADSVGTATTVFSGRVSDVDLQVVPVGSGTLAGYRVTAVGPLAGANRRQTLAGGRPVELDGARVLAALFGALSVTWEEFPLDVAFEDAEGSWDSFTGPIAVDEIDPGVFNIAALGSADAGYAALGVVQEAAFSGDGVLYENRFGQVGYADAARRANTFASGTAIDVPVSALRADGLSASSSLSELANRAIVTYEGGVEQADIPESIVQFGLFVRRLDTQLTSQSEALNRAQRFVEEHSLPVFKADSFSLLLNSQTDSPRDELLTVEPNDLIVFDGMPPQFGFDRLTAFVEGIEWRFDDQTAEVRLFASDERLSVGGVWWGRVTDTLEWDDVDAQLEWQQVGRTL
jgi:hypothetical protein